MLVAAHVRGKKILAAFAAPFHRPRELARRVAGDRVLGIEAGLHAEAAPQIADHDAELFGLRLEYRGERVARAGRLLRLRVERPAIAGVFSQRAARLERHCGY